MLQWGRRSLIELPCGHDIYQRGFVLFLDLAAGDAVINGYSIAVADGAAHDAVIRLPLFSLLVGQHEEASGCIADAFPACTCVGNTVGSIQRSVGVARAEGGAGLGGLLIQIKMSQ